ncbi:MAG: hypothetical protein BJ554DRAFT_7664, partial [Olpidium bornovanus]
MLCRWAAQSAQLRVTGPACGDALAPRGDAKVRKVFRQFWREPPRRSRLAFGAAELGPTSGTSHTLRRALHCRRAYRQPFTAFVAGCRGSPLLFSSSLRHTGGNILRSNHDASSSLALVGRRYLGHQTPFRALAHLVRIPAAFVTAGAGAVTFAQYKMSEFRDKYIPKWLSETVNDVRNSAKEKWDMFREKDFSVPELELPAFLANIFRGTEGKGGSTDSEERGAGSERSDSAADPSPPTVAVAAVVATAASNVGEEESSAVDLPRRDDQLMLLTKRLIEVRNVLKKVDSADGFKLPSLVVIGSQSSGKSSVLEAIVGHEFLPKGSNMVTRRPIELTLIHTPDTDEEYGEFPQIHNERIHDFQQVQS